MGDFLEVMSFYGFDLEAADEHVRQRENLYTPALLEEIMEESCVD